MSRLGWITIGGVVMSLLLGLIALAALPQQEATPAGGQTATIETDDPAIIDTARRFLELGDQGNWAETSRMTGARLQKRNPAERRRAVSEKERTTTGAMRSRVLQREPHMTSPTAGYEVVNSRTK